MTVITMKKKIAEYLETADAKKVKALYNYVGEEIGQNACEWDQEFTKELERRENSFLDGSAKMYTWEETKQAAINSVKAKKSGLRIKNT